ncbi:MAG TPA: HNH endonuclease [Nitrospira sp.]|nr:HNH endonuclease [Nitrospira sp.]
MPFVLNHDTRNISDNDLLRDLRRVSSDQAGQVKQRTYKDLGKYGVTTIIRRFGTWNNAIKEAGLATSVEKYIPDKKLFVSLYDLWVRLGRQPVYSDIHKPACQFHVATYERRFGSWRKALEAFVSYANSEEMAAPVVSKAADAVAHRLSRSADLRLRFKVLQRDRFRCCACGASPTLTPGVVLEVDHVKPWSKGGETVTDNLQTLCRDCNQGKTNYHS